MTAREDFNGRHFEATYKEMPSGEERWRIKPVGLMVHALHISKAASSGWQKPHFHPALTESYLVLNGRLICGSWNEAGDDIKIGEIRPEDGVFIVLPNYRHNIYTLPGAEFLTWQHGVLTPNPDRNGQDWWPVLDIPSQVETLLENYHLITFE